ncbi:hypothetical protein HPB50_012790 [Hyalomma asiaticum]|uniref:Uncharacterized protein n=1 Tax=Hyalomma asiaticum TaxID=266040 RepID=A0ACB7SDE2_HYAAI|nr:hypothetical protein HPB50_012790 [Hyalomma asiaticum]
MFAALKDGDVSEVEDCEDDVDEALEDVCDSKWDAQEEELSATSSDDEAVNITTEDRSWSRKAFKKPTAMYQPAGDENKNDSDGLASPCEYFARYVPKSVFADLAEKTNIFASSRGKISSDK